MRIHRVLIIPTAGHLGAGVYDRGRAVPSMAEVDVVAGYMPALIDELEIEHVRFHTLETHSSPGLTASERIERVEANDLVIHLRAGILPDESKATRNHSIVTYGGCSPAQAKALAERVTDYLYEWGQCVVFGHVCKTPVKAKADPYIDTSRAIGITIEPFALNGPDAGQYAGRLDRLGRDLGMVIADFVRGVLR